MSQPVRPRSEIAERELRRLVAIGMLSAPAKLLARDSLASQTLSGWERVWSHSHSKVVQRFLNYSGKISGLSE